MRMVGGESRVKPPNPIRTHDLMSKLVIYQPIQDPVKGYTLYRVVRYCYGAFNFTM